MGAKRPGIIGNAEWMTHAGVHSRSRPRDCKAESAPATPLGNREGKAAQRPASQETGRVSETQTAVGDDGEGVLIMTTQTQALAKGTSAVRTEIAAIFAVALIGLGIVFVAGHAQAGALHDAAHDVRHATGFPCH